MANPVGFEILFKNYMQTRTKDQRLDYLTSLFQDLVVTKPETSEIDLSDRVFSLVAKKAYKGLFQSETKLEDWNGDFLQRVLESGLLQLKEIQDNTECLKEWITGQCTRTTVIIELMIRQGVDLSDYELYRLAFQNQTLDTINIVKQFLASDCTPNEMNLNHLIAQNSKYTIEILEQFRPYPVVFPNSCLTYALKYRGKDQKQVVQFLINQGIIPTEQQCNFATCHCPIQVQKIIKSAAGEKALTDNASFFLPAKAEVGSIPTVRAVIRKQDDFSIHSLLAHFAVEGKFKSGYLNYWIKNPGSRSLEILRLFLMCGLKLSDRQWIDMIDAKFPDIDKVLILHKMYGYGLSQEVWNKLIERNTKEGSSTSAGDPVLEALDVKLPYVCSVDKNFKGVVIEYLSRVPGLFELLLKSGIQPSLKHIRAFLKAPKDSFFELLLNDAYFESNSYNRDLIDMAIKTASGSVVMRLVNRGFPLEVLDVINGVKMLREKTSSALNKKLRKSESLVELKNFPIEDEDDNILAVLANQASCSLQLLRDFLDEGIVPENKHVAYLNDHQTEFTPELLQEIEKSGLQI